MSERHENALGSTDNILVELIIRAMRPNGEADELEAPSGWLALSFENEGDGKGEVSIAFFDAASLLAFVAAACHRIGVDVEAVVRETAAEDPSGWTVHPSYRDAANARR